MEQYIADKKIELVVVLEGQTTPNGAEMVEVSYTDGTKEVMPKKRLELVSTEEKSSATELRNTMCARVGALMYSIMHEYGVKWGEINAIMEATGALCDDGFYKASNINFGVEDKDQVTLISINNILLKNINDKSNKESDNGATSEGEESDNSNQD